MFRSMNLTVRQALLSLLAEHNLVLLEDPITSIARITYTNQVVNFVDKSLLDSVTNEAASIEMQHLPIQFQDVPITTGLESLARLAGINYVLDPKIGYGLPDKNGQIKTEPLLSFRWDNVTAKQGFIALCENYDFVVVKNPTTSVFLITAIDHSITNFVDASLLGSDTNEFIPIQIVGNLIFQGQACSNTNAIEIQNVPLDVALAQLAKVAQIKIVLDPRLSREPAISLGWQRITPKQAIVALCDNYNLSIMKNSATGDIQIIPKN